MRSVPQLLPLQPRQHYVVVHSLSDWKAHPINPLLVRDGTVLAIFTPDNVSDHVMVYYNFTQDTRLVPRSDIYIFDWEARSQTNTGLTPAFVGT